MRLIMTFAIAVAVTMLTLGAVGTWADAKARADNSSSISAAIDPFAMMVAAKDLPAPQYAEPF